MRKEALSSKLSLLLLLVAHRLLRLRHPQQAFSETCRLRLPRLLVSLLQPQT